MRLTAEIFETITSSLTSDHMPGRAYEKRTAPRVGLRLRVTITRVVEGVAQTAACVRVRDISTRGIGLLHTERFRVGERFVAQLPRGGAEILCVIYRVTQCALLTAGLYLIGAVMEQTSISPSRDAAARCDRPLRSIQS